MAIPEPGCCDGPEELLRKILLGLPEISTGGGGSAISVENEGVQITAGVTNFDFVGGGVTATAVGNDVTVTIPAGGTGDVVGPASAVDDRIATFDGATGKLIQDSGVLISSVVTTSTLQSGSQIIGAGVETISVVFGTAFALAPTVVASMSRPVAENLLFVNIDEASITVAGFTATISGITGSANYRLKWMAK